jgi:hypothetical protein
MNVSAIDATDFGQLEPYRTRCRRHSTDTDTTRGFEIPKATPEAVARAILGGVEQGDEDIFPDPTSAAMADSWRNGAAKALEHQFAAVVEAA